MKYIFIILTISVLMSCMQQVEHTLIKGTINGEIPEKIFYTSPVEGACNIEFSEAVTLDSLGNFTITLNNTKPIFLRIAVKRRSASYYLIVEPNKKYNIELDISKDSNTELVNNNAVVVQKLYDGFAKEKMMSCTYYTDDDLDGYDNILDSLNRSLGKELKSISDLLNANQVSEDVYQLIKQDRKVYYATMNYRLISACNRHFIRKNGETSKEIMDLWERAYSNIDISNPETLQAIHAYDLLDSKIWYNMYRRYNIDKIKEIRDKFRKNGLIHTHSISLSKEYLCAEVQEYYIASYISKYSSDRRNKKAKEFLEIMDQFKKDFPNSPYLKFFEKNIEKIKHRIDNEVKEMATIN